MLASQVVYVVTENNFYPNLTVLRGGKFGRHQFLHSFLETEKNKEICLT